MALMLRGWDVRTAYFDSVCGTVHLNGQPVDVRPPQPKKIHPFDLYDLLMRVPQTPADFVAQQDEPVGVIVLKGERYATDTSLAYHGTNPEFVRHMLKHGGSVVSS